jgi:hypothetical protein
MTTVGKNDLCAQKFRKAQKLKKNIANFFCSLHKQEKKFMLPKNSKIPEKTPTVIS